MDKFTSVPFGEPGSGIIGSYLVPVEQPRKGLLEEILDVVTTVVLTLAAIFLIVWLVKILWVLIPGLVKLTWGLGVLVFALLRVGAFIALNLVTGRPLHQVMAAVRA